MHQLKVALPLIVAASLACGGNIAAQTPPSTVKKSTSPSVVKPAVIEGFSKPESLYQSGNKLYVSNIGDGQGYISKVDLLTNKVEEAHFLPDNGGFIKTGEKGTGPLGVKVVENTLYAASYDKVYGFDLKSRKTTFELAIPGSTRLNGVEFADGKLLVSETNNGSIYQIDLTKKTSTQYVTDPDDRKKLDGVNGLVWDGSSGVLYATANKGNRSPNTVLSIDGKTRKVTILYSNTGPGSRFFDGMKILNHQLYICDWKHSIFTLPVPVANADISNVKTTALPIQALSKGLQDYDGPPDIVISEDGDYYIFPLLQSGKVVIEKRAH